MAKTTAKAKSDADFEANTRKYYPSVYCMNTANALPKCWSVKEKSNQLFLSNSNLTTTYRPREHWNQTQPEAGCVRADHHIPCNAGVYYYEIHVDILKETGSIAVGVATHAAHLYKCPGSNSSSIGYYSKDGSVHNDSGSNHGIKHLHRFVEGDTVGCGVSFVDNTVFFTLNGQIVGLPIENKIVSVPVQWSPSLLQTSLNAGQLYPCVGLSGPGVKASVNFGQHKFLFDFTNYVKVVREAYNRRFVTHLTDDLSHHKMKDLVAAYLVHHGYSETVQVFAKWAGRNSEADLSSIQLRQEIQHMIHEGRIEEALASLMENYPTVFTPNGELTFQLKCRQFIEMLRQKQAVLASLSTRFCSQTYRTTRKTPTGTGHSPLSSSGSETSSGPIPKMHRGSSPTAKPFQMKLQQLHPRDEVAPGTGVAAMSMAHAPPLVMEEETEFMEFESADTSTESSHNGHQIDGPADIDLSGYSDVEIVQRLVELGRFLYDMAAQLRRDGRLSDSSEKLLKDAFSLMAYRDPYKSPVNYLLDKKCKEQTASLVNSAILMAQKMPQRPNLERAIQNLDQCMEYSAKGNIGLVGFVHPRMLLQDHYVQPE